MYDSIRKLKICIRILKIFNSYSFIYRHPYTVCYRFPYVNNPTYFVFKKYYFAV